MTTSEWVQVILFFIALGAFAVAFTFVLNTFYMLHDILKDEAKKRGLR